MNWELSRIVPDIENAFGIAIPDEDAARLDTVGRLYDYVLTYRFGEDYDDRPGRIAFQEVRQALMSVQRLSRDAVHACTKLSAVIPRHRRRVWRTIAKQTGYRLPMLRRPDKVVMMATLGAIGLGVSVPVAMGLTPMHGANVAAVISIALFGYILYGLTEFLAHQLPADVVTVGDLAKAVLARNYQAILAESKRSESEEEVWDTVRQIVAEKLGLLPSEVGKDMDLSRHFIAS
jgi:hypothetical protein